MIASPILACESKKWHHRHRNGICQQRKLPVGNRPAHDESVEHNQWRRGRCHELTVEPNDPPAPVPVVVELEMGGPSGIETQPYRVTNEIWLTDFAGRLNYEVYWVNVFGHETLLEECSGVVSPFGDISCIMAPGVTDVVQLHTYLYGPEGSDISGLVMVNWVNLDDEVFQVAHDGVNLGPRVPMVNSWAAAPYPYPAN